MFGRAFEYRQYVGDMASGVALAKGLKMDDGAVHGVVYSAASISAITIGIGTGGVSNIGRSKRVL